MKRNKLGSQTSHLVIIGIALLCIGLISINARQTDANNPKSIGKLRPATRSQSPKIVIKSQNKAPLQISATLIQAVTVNTPIVQLEVTNVDSRAITAYGIRYDTLSTHSKAGGVELSNKQSPDSVLQPNHSELITVGEGTVFSDQINLITLSIDFVEFTDGATWGEDSYKSKERLLGQRAGAEAASQSILRELKVSPSTLVLSRIVSNTFEIAPEPGHSEEWLSGFRVGVSAVQERIKRAFAKGGKAQMEAELLLPYDASQRRK